MLSSRQSLVVTMKTMKMASRRYEDSGHQCNISSKLRQYMDDLNPVWPEITVLLHAATLISIYPKV